MKRILFCWLLLLGFAAHSQVYNNEWIDFSKTYYKFKLVKSGLYRLSQSTLAAAGLGTVPAEQFQLWRNGTEVPIFTSAASGALPGGGYIEFWGEYNDGQADKQLYKNPDYQLNDKVSLLSDSAVYFLTVNPSGNNRRLQSTANNVSGNTLPAEPYFMQTVGKYFTDKLNFGLYGVVEGLTFYSPAYDKAEGWTSGDIGVNATATFTFNNLQVYTAGPASTLNIAVSGNSSASRSYLVKVNNDSVLGSRLDSFSYAKTSAGFATSKLSSNTATIQVTNVCAEAGCPANNMVLAKLEITYPMQFNFGGAANFEFNLPASSTGNYLQISNFSYGATPPVLYDLTNGKRYVADISAAPLVRIVLEPSSTSRRLILVNEEAANISAVTGLSTRTFVNYNQAANQGDYLIITNPVLQNGANGANPVDQYRAYRSSAAGGGYNAHVYLVDELVDQFGFGIKKSPLAIRNFIRFARNKFTTPPKSALLLGRAVTYVEQRYYENNPDMDRLNLVPTFGYPASDILLGAEPGNSYPETPVGRVAAINAQEVSDYLEKVKGLEQSQAALSPNVADRDWLKNVVHLIGISEPNLNAVVRGYMDVYKFIASDTLTASKVSTFSNSSTSSVSQINNASFTDLMNKGIGLITYFGHSATGTLEFNIDNPEAYNNTGRYPVMSALGCNAGNLYSFDTRRFLVREGLSEKYVLAPQKGMIGFIASTSYGIVHYLNIWASGFYRAFAQTDYGRPIGELMKSAAIKELAFTSANDFFSRVNVEELQLHGDPAVRISPQQKADYVISDPMVKISPSFISVAQNSFKVTAKWNNIGMAPYKKIVVEFRRQYPDQSSKVVYRDTLYSTHFEDSVVVDIPIDASKDKGSNRLTVTIDADNNVDEYYENNNLVTKDFIIYEDEARPVYPYDLSIVNQQNIRFAASTADPFSTVKQYRMELDTTELFNSPLKVSQTLTSAGGLLEFSPGITFTNNTVYYWRVGAMPASGNINWNGASFLYLQGQDVGFNQSHFYQHLKSEGRQVYLDSSSRQWKFSPVVNQLFVRNGVFPTAASQAGDFTISINGDESLIRSVCGLPNIIVNVFDPVTFKPWFNGNAGAPGQYGSDVVCGSDRAYNFQFTTSDATKRKNLVAFLDLIPSGYIVVVRNTAGTAQGSNTYASDWQNDTAALGSGNSVYHRLLNQGFTGIDSFNRPRAWIFTYVKNDAQTFKPQFVFSQGIYDKITLSGNFSGVGSAGIITSPVFGPAKTWKQLKWRGTSLESNSADKPLVSIIGRKSDGSSAILFNNLNLGNQDIDLSSVNSRDYPFLQIQMSNSDLVKLTPYQLGSWQLLADFVPEGALAPNLFSRTKDSSNLGESIDFQMAFKNISPWPFDSLLVKAVITDKDNVQHALPSYRIRPLAAQDTAHVHWPIDTRQFSGSNSLYVEVNPENDQPEQYHFNNFAYKNFYVRFDELHPLMDVTFDNVHILNHDIVSARPNIVISLKDESSKVLLTDTSLISIRVRYPDGTIRPFNFNSDTLRFTPASQSTDNTATVSFTPSFGEDGDYELIVSGKDMSGNQAGDNYKVAFQVVNKSMISNMLNYPNPFTTSTSFVFTLTGNEVPQNLKIQILTVTGKVVREITKQELGPLHIGRNITEFKWDGTDQYGQKLGNGVYLYRVTTNLNGKSLDKFTSDSDNTDKYFNKGYGKMYLMR